MMDHGDDWPDELLDGDLEAAEDLDSAERQNAEQIARDTRNMDAVLAAMAGQMSEGLQAVEGGRGALARRRATWRWRAAGTLAAAAVAAALILAGDEGIEDSGEPIASAGESHTPSMMAEMDVEADGPFVVFPTSDPDIAVVWLLNPKESD
ncbi:MAG: hypothetical protein F4Z31_16240 [Gemmatimonadetes bacterium]|nr:hypothetical protein [Gemmatimonadota bacterium]MYA43281.1 hypothetical protein [Gemmatimonadota bacterium]